MRALRAWVVSSLVVALASCQFDGTVAPGVEVRCAVTADCPPGQVCAPALGRCVPADSPDREAPTLRSALLARSLLKRGDQLVVDFTVSEALARPPQLRLVQTGVVAELSVEQLGAGSEPTYRGTVTIGAAVVEGGATVVAQLIDLAGNEASGVPVAALALDFTAPVVEAVTYVAPREAVAGVAEVRASELISVQVRLSEPVDPSDVVLRETASCAAAGSWSLTSNRQGVLEFTRPPVGSPSACRLALTLRGAKDLAGNSQVPEEVPLSADVVVDPVAPTVSPVVAGRATDGGFVPAVRFSHAPGFDVVTLRFAVDRSTVQLGGRLDDAPLADCGLAQCAATDAGFDCRCQYAVGGAAGLHDVALTAFDRAGNAGSAGTTVSFDFTPPSVSRVEFIAPRSGDGGTIPVRPDEAVALRVSLSEPVPSAALRLDDRSSCAAAARALELVSNRDGLLDFTRAATFEATGCAHTLSLAGLVDEAGNAAAATIPLPADFVIDGAGPALTQAQTWREKDAGLLAATRFSAEPDFQRLVLTFQVASDAVAVNGRLDGVPLAGCDGAACIGGADGGRSCTCRQTVAADAGERTHVLSMIATDEAGNVSTTERTVSFDFTAPQLVPGTAVLTLTPPPGCPLRSVSAAAPGASVQLAFSLDEVAGPRPLATARAAASTLPLAWTSGQTTSFTFATALDGSVPDGVYDLEAVVADDLGNQRVVALGDAGVSLTVDGTPPATPAAASAAVVYHRAPWGEAGGPPTFTVTFDGGVAPGVTLRAFDGPSPATASEVGRGVALGGPFTLPLARADRAVVYLTAVDSACNESPSADVKHVDWLATLGGKRVGSALENPHRWELRPSFLGVDLQPGAVEPDAGALTSEDGVVVSVRGEPTWRRRPIGNHVVDSDFAMVWDGNTQRVLKTTYSSGAAVELWAWDGTNWGLLSPTDPEGDGDPPRRTTPTLAFDRHRSRVVMVAGGSSTGALSDTWEWDGQSWRQAAALPFTPPQQSCAMAYDAVRRETVLRCASTLGWDGLSWKTFPAGGPGPVGRPGALAWDDARGCIVAVDGTNTWEWRGTSWTNRGALGLPVQSSVMLTYDEAAGGVLLLGNTGTFTFDGTSWTNAGGPQPPARIRSGMAYDSRRRRPVVFGGVIATRAQDTWEWTGAGWLNRTPPNAAPAARSYPTQAYDSARAQLLVAGGNANAALLSDVWEFDGGQWANRTSTPRPGARMASQAMFDADAGVVVLFSGASAGADTWQWSGTAWSALGVLTPAPTAREGAGFVFDVARQVGVLFGGMGAGFSAETWEYAAGVWTARPLAGPSGRGRLGMAYDARRARTVLFGGMASASYPTDVWEFDGAQWLNRTPSGPSPQGRRSPGFAYDATRDRTVLFGGQSENGTLLGDQWDWDGVRWTETTPFVRPSARTAPALQYDAARGVLVLFGGYTLSADSNELWEHAIDPADAPGHVGRFTFAASGAEPGAQYQALSVQAVAGADGQRGGGPVAGATLALWRAFGFVESASNAAPTGAPAAIAFDSTDAAEIAQLLGPGRELRLALRTVGTNGSGLATLSADAVSVRVRYLRP